MFSDKEKFKQEFTKRLESTLGKKVMDATDGDVYRTLCILIKERLSHDWHLTNQKYEKNKVKQVYYFSMEFLLGRLLGNNLLNMKVFKVVEMGLQDLGFSLMNLEEEEERDAGLGNGGLGRLAACFLDSLASLELPGHGYGIRYKYGMFEQHIIDGYQVELPDQWLQKEFVWEVRKEEEAVEVHYGGYVTPIWDGDMLTFQHSDYEQVRAVPYDVPIVGYDCQIVNTLRLWSAEPTVDDILVKARTDHSFPSLFSHQRALESISEFLYPDDSNFEGKRLRLKQEYFLVASGVQSAIRSFEHLQLPWSVFPEKIAFHINDTHPTLVIPELMRILMDEHQLEWDQAWQITQNTVSYTNHTTLSEALETWPVELVSTLLPRIFMIINEINERFCQSLWKSSPDDFNRIAKLAIIADGQVKMAHLSIVGSHSINGVAKLHTEILKKREMKAFYETFPERFNNKTNGITHRRWLMHANPPLSNLITETIGERWKKEPERLRDLLQLKDDHVLLDKLYAIKQQNKQRLAKLIRDMTGTEVDPTSIFDVQVKRLHGYKRQLLNALHIIYLYNKIKADPLADMMPRTFIFGAKAATGYYFAKKVIKLINTISDVINHDLDVKDKLKVIFLENYSVSLAEWIIPAANISEQISTASKEASGTGNMKFMMNGAVTLGTLDGANVEIFDSVGRENIYTFGMSAEEVLAYNNNGYYSAKVIYETDEELRHTLNQLQYSSPFTKEIEFGEIYDALLAQNDEYFVLQDFASYVAMQQQIGHDYLKQRSWNQKGLVNIAHSGMFSSDETIRLYASEIWRL